jgi:hypothetical protein
MMRRRNPNINEPRHQNSTSLPPIFFLTPAPMPLSATNSLPYNRLRGSFVIDFGTR